MADKRAHEPSSTPRATPEVVDAAADSWVGLMGAAAAAVAVATAWLALRTLRRRHR